MRLLLFGAIAVLLLAACETHVKGPENRVLTPEGEPVVVNMAGGESCKGELVEVTGTNLILKEQGHYVVVDLSTIQRVQVTRYGLSLEGSLSELPPYSRYPQGLTTEQRKQLLEMSGQKDVFKLPLIDMTSEKLRIADKKTEPAAIVASKESHSLPPSGKGADSDSQNSFFDTRTGMTWIIVDSAPIGFSGANSICASLETGDIKKYRVPSLREFEELWKRYKNDESISIFKRREYSADSKDESPRLPPGYTKTFSFANGNSGQLYAAYLTCVRD